MLDTLKSMGYLTVKELWYVVDRRLQLLYDDNESINMVNIAKRKGEVHLYVVHIVSEAVVVDDDLESNLEYVIVEVNAKLGGGGLTEVVLGVEVRLRVSWEMEVKMRQTWEVEMRLRLTWEVEVRLRVSWRWR